MTSKERVHELAFMGGIDTQELLPNGSAADLRSGVRSPKSGV
ncbi:MAG TPA: hypothetical protein VMO47_00825 [Rhodothermales bacterium]|nr:hypothetical protein [Rhodothermales bacterium]